MKNSMTTLTKQELRTIKGGDTPPVPPTEPTILSIEDIDKKDVKNPGGN